MIDNKVILITGGTGSFGKAVLNRYLNTDLFSEIRIFSRDEKKQDDLRQKLNNPKVKFIIGDVRDYYSVENAVNGADYIFHAAALKQVPSCEFFPMEAVKTNILGTDNVLRAAEKYNTKRQQNLAEWKIDNRRIAAGWDNRSTAYSRVNRKRGNSSRMDKRKDER